MRNYNGYGSVYKLSGNRRNPWTARVVAGYKPSKDGLKVYPDYNYLGYYRTKKEAQEALAEFNFNATPKQQKRQKTLESVYEEWSEKWYKEMPKTRDVYQSAWKILAPMHKMDINTITLRTIEEVFQSSGKNHPMLVNAKIVLKALYKYAAKYEWTTTDKIDIIALADTGKDNPNSRPHKRIPKEIIDELWEDNSQLSRSILFMIYSGVRVSEMLNLETANINTDERYFEIVHSKTASGVRFVPIHDKIYPWVKNSVESNSKHLLSFDWLYTYKRPYAKYLELFSDRLNNEFTTHDCRHTFISMMQEAVVPDVIIKSIVGHKGRDITQSVYTHISIEAKLDWINKIE